MNSPATLAAERLGSLIAARTRSSSDTCASAASIADQSASFPAPSASRKTASA